MLLYWHKLSISVRIFFNAALKFDPGYLLCTVPSVPREWRAILRGQLETALMYTELCRPQSLGTLQGGPERKALGRCRVNCAGAAQQAQEDLSHAAYFKDPLTSQCVLGIVFIWRKDLRKASIKPIFSIFDLALHTLQLDIRRPLTRAAYAGSVQDN